MDAIHVADTIWLVLIEIVGHETVEQYTAELAEAIGKGVKLSLEDAGASETTQIVAATVVEAGVSFTVLNGLRATMDEGGAARRRHVRSARGQRRRLQLLARAVTLLLQVCVEGCERVVGVLQRLRLVLGGRAFALLG